MIGVEIYLVLVLLLSASMVVFNKKALEKKSLFEAWMFFTFIPITAIIILIEMIFEEKRK